MACVGKQSNLVKPFSQVGCGLSLGHGNIRFLSSTNCNCQSVSNHQVCRGRGRLPAARASISRIDGVESVETAVNTGTVVITMKPGARLDEADAKRAVEAAGFTMRDFRRKDDGA